MEDPGLEPRIAEDLRAALSRGFAAGDLLSATQVAQQTALFRERFGPPVLGQLNGEALLRLMHGRENVDARCLTYWLEFKNDEEFQGHRFGRIGGGSALKFGIYQRNSDDAWVSGSPSQQRVLSLDEAVAVAERQRDELLAGAAELAKLDPADSSDSNYAQFQSRMDRAAPALSGDGWSHKYWFLVYPDRLDDYHSPRYQRFHLFKLLQMPPDEVGILDGTAPRFLCAGRYVKIAKALDVPTNSLLRMLNERDGAFHRYWRLGTTVGSGGESQWDVMRDGGFVSLGWRDSVPDLSEILGEEPHVARAQIREWLLREYADSPGVATRKAGEILNFCREMGENDLVLACEGQNVLGVGRIRGSYHYDKQLAFPHTRPVEWLLLERWKTLEPEGLQTTVKEIGKNAKNLLDLEQRLFGRGSTSLSIPPRDRHQPVVTNSLPPLDPVVARIEGILLRKGQVVLYGPPGTGKTYRAMGSAVELASRKAFQKVFAELTGSERAEIEGPDGLVRLCSFHPGYSYEDFVEGLRPKLTAGQMIFEPRNGVFKELCAAARKRPDRHFFLIVDEINRGDLPRIFGELITVIEFEKRDNPVILPLTHERFTVPRNVFLVGTMNTADRSISLMDTALRRRFGFVELMPDSTALGTRSIQGVALGPWLDALNSRLRRLLKRDARNLQIGHSYLLPAQNVISVADLGRVVRDEIIPLLEEYCYDDFQTLKDILGAELVDVGAGRIRDELFLPNREDDLIQALSFEEIPSIALAQRVPDDTADSSNDGEEESAE